MITGWKEICKAMKLSKNTLKRLQKKEGFPIIYLGSKPATTQHLIDEWVLKKISQKNENAQIR